MSENPMEEAFRQGTQTAAGTGAAVVQLVLAFAKIAARNAEQERAATDADQLAQIEQLREVEGKGSSAYADAQRESEEYLIYARQLDAKYGGTWKFVGGVDQQLEMSSVLRDLRDAGVNIRNLVGDIEVTADRVMQEAAQGTGRPAAGTPAQMVRDHVPNPTVRDALLTSPEWPQIGDRLTHMRAEGVDIPRALGAVSSLGARVQEAVSRAWSATTDRVKQLIGETGRGTTSDRQAALQDVGISPQENQRFVRLVRESVPDRHQASVLALCRQWPAVAAHMRDLESKGVNVAERLQNLPREVGRLAANGARVDVAEAAFSALSTPTGELTKPRPTAARTHAVGRPLSASGTQLVDAADAAASMLGISSDFLMSRQGLTKEQAGDVLTHLESAKIIGPRAENGRHEALVLDREQARTVASEAAKQWDFTAAPTAQPSAVPSLRNADTAAAANAASSTAHRAPENAGDRPVPAPAARPQPTHTANRGGPTHG